MSERTTDDRDDPDEETFVDNVPDGAGCTEIWEHLSEQREAKRD